MINDKFFILDNSHENECFEMPFPPAPKERAQYCIGVQNRELTHLIFDDSLNNTFLTIDAENTRELHIDGVFFKELKNSKITINAGLNTVIHVYFCEISHYDIDLAIEINLFGIESKTDVNIVSIGLEKSTKCYNVTVKHYGAKTISNIDCKGISKDNSFVKFFPYSLISLDTPNCSARQSSRIINLDDFSRGQIKPMLEINNNEVTASHSAVLGSLKDDELFYMLARGIDYKKARYLIVKGLVSPTFDGLLNIENKQKFKVVLERGIK